MKGKDKCRILKQIRKRIADENDIPYVVEECTHKGECKGTCPKCEAELRQLERELSLRHRMGKAVAVAGLAAGMVVATAGCSVDDVIDFIGKSIEVNDPGNVQGYILSGDVIMPEDLQGKINIKESLIEEHLEDGSTIQLPDMFHDGIPFGPDGLNGRDDLPGEDSLYGEE